MALHQKPPGEGGKRAHVHWSFTSTGPGAKNQWHGYIAGPCNWFECHSRNKKSKPCLHAITNGALKCDQCSPFVIPFTIGYQPIYRALDGKPVVVIVHEYSREQIDTLQFHERVLIGRGEATTDPVWIMSALVKTPLFKTTLSERNRPSDITVSLLAMWGMPELTEWLQTNGGIDEPTTQTPPPVKVPKVQLKSDKKPFSPLMQAAANKYTPPEGAPDTQELFNGVARRVKERVEQAEKNGKH